MITRLTKTAIVFSVIFMCGKEMCIAQNNSHIEVSAYKVSVTNTDITALLDTMYSLVDKCGIETSSLFFYICESDFDGGNHYFGKALAYEASSYREMWSNEDLDDTNGLFWGTYYFYHRGILCICNADHKNLFKDISKSSDILSLPLNMPQKNLFYLVVLPLTSSNQPKYSIYTSCD